MNEEWLKEYDDILDEMINGRKSELGKGLTNPFSRYLTGLEGICETQDIRFYPGCFKWQQKQKGLDTDKFRKQCEDIDAMKTKSETINERD